MPATPLPARAIPPNPPAGRIDVAKLASIQLSKHLAVKRVAVGDSWRAVAVLFGEVVHGPGGDAVWRASPYIVKSFGVVPITVVRRIVVTRRFRPCPSQRLTARKAMRLDRHNHPDPLVPANTRWDCI